MSRPPLPAANQEWALFLDVDGTLLELAPRPDEVVVPARVLTVLSRLASRLQGAVALVSGRRVVDLDRIFGPLRLPAAGLHGLERRRADGSMTRQEDGRPELDRVYRRLAAFAAKAAPGLLVEDKGGAVAIHFRLAPDLQERVLAEVEQALAEVGGDLHVQKGKMVMEVKPRTAHKGDAIRAFMGEPPFAGRVPVFVGDDLTDEDGFSEINARSGISIAVGRDGATRARWRLRDATEVLLWLESLSRAR